ncbi:MAG: transglutaminase domain-containing protein [Oscillospiraceae bacterium]|nr:transglutaminase domain-containing protein [Oscillospiraceae bacterium]MBR0450891.1 transglutaminase domain-containing protein [Oscillospiraceae bacterium]
MHFDYARKITALIILLGLALLLNGCGAEIPGFPSRPSESEPESVYEIPEMKMAYFHPEAAEGNSEAKLDISCVNEGYVALRVDSDAGIKFQVLKDEDVYTYSVIQREDQIFPLQWGDGDYIFRVMKNVEDNKYYEIYRCETSVVLDNEFDPFLRPNQYADFYEGRACVELAREFAEESKSDTDFVGKVYKYVCKNITYDDDKAQMAVDGQLKGYVPDPDRTLEEKKGICFDYACLAASMLRSQGVPTKIIFGYVAPDDLYHAWNMFYTKEGGWVTVKFSAPEDEWSRIDLTFSANGADSKFIGDGSNYMDVYQF